LLTNALDSARESFELLMSVGAGTGLIYLLRWFWWRINAWSEIAAMASSFVVAVGFFIAAKMGSQIPSHISLLVTIAVTTVVWVATTYATKPTDRATLVRFYRLVRPAGPGWSQLRAETGLAPSPDSLPQAFLGWMAGCVFVYSALFGAGSFLYGKTAQGTVWLVLFVISTWYLSRLLPRLWSATDDAVDPPVLARVGAEADD
jgi:hypothetical protein